MDLDSCPPGAESAYVPGRPPGENLLPGLQESKNFISLILYVPGSVFHRLSARIHGNEGFPMDLDSAPKGTGSAYVPGEVSSGQSTLPKNSRNCKNHGFKTFGALAPLSMRFSRYRSFWGERIFEILLCTRAVCIQVSPWDPEKETNPEKRAIKREKRAGLCISHIRVFFYCLINPAPLRTSGPPTWTLSKTPPVPPAKLHH